jgi:hypothetical protein
MKILNAALAQDIPAAPLKSATSSHPDDHIIPEAIDQRASGDEEVVVITPQDHKS